MNFISGAYYQKRSLNHTHGIYCDPQQNIEKFSGTAMPPGAMFCQRPCFGERFREEEVRGKWHSWRHILCSCSGGELNRVVPPSHNPRFQWTNSRLDEHVICTTDVKDFNSNVIWDLWIKAFKSWTQFKYVEIESKEDQHCHIKMYKALTLIWIYAKCQLSHGISQHYWNKSCCLAIVIIWLIVVEQKTD